MILVDSSVWVDHFRAGDAELSRLLNGGQVLVHPFVTGELALGNLRQRTQVLRGLRDLPQSVVATDEEVQRLIESRRLFGMGIGYVDAHLLAAVLLTPGATLWTRDARLQRAALSLGAAAKAQ